MSDFIGIADLGPDGLAEVLALGAEVKKDPAGVAGTRSGLRVGLFFMKPSTRTRVSSEVATVDLGGHPVVLRQDEVGLGSRESVRDVACTLDRYLDVLALRVFEHGTLVEVADAAQAPVINLLSDLEHPCQVLADLQTVAENFPLTGSRLAYVGDGNNVCHSLMVAAAMAGMEVRVAAPPSFQPDPVYVSEASRFGTVEVSPDPEAAVEGADVVYTDAWTSMGQEEEQQARVAQFSGFRVDEALFENASDEAIFLHCLPAHRGEEVSDGVIDHARSRVFDQAENRLHSFKALLLHLTE
ncbi:MAG: ornithine carbamoyltransferase [Acidimicrobiia bacterium]